MSYSPQVFTSGFHFDVPNGGSGRGAPFSGVHPGIFRPPASPSVSSSSMYNLGRSTTSLQSDANTAIHNAKRKRTVPRESTPFSDWGATGDAACNADNIIADRSDFDLRTDGRDRQYVLAGQIETPDGVARKEFGSIEDSVYSDVDYRRALGPKRLHGDVNSPASTPMTPDHASQRQAGWGSYAISTIGGVVGKVWEFCTAGAFRGFYAGGGQGYELSQAQRDALQQSPTDDQAMHDHSEPIMPAHDPNPFQAGFHQSDHSALPFETESPESTPPPAAKRRQLWNGGPHDELQKNWVVVDEPANAPRQPSFAPRALPRRAAPRTASSLARRMSKPAGRFSTSTFNRQPNRPNPAPVSPVTNYESTGFISAVSPDTPSTAPAYTPSRIPVPARPQTPSLFAASQFTPQPSKIPSPSPYTQLSHRRNQSAVSTSSAQMKLSKRDSLHDMQDNSPRLDAKARNLAARRMREGMEADSRINDLNARLRDMIRQGKEALGTTYEVESYDDGTKGGEAWESENDDVF
ncbi:hypothetical protein GGS21DRAFT_314727 [Xylaria nigripes]|nr:hypothetical protein GGS21DRAFT_314727 [Xylaria nigripes]